MLLMICLFSSTIFFSHSSPPQKIYLLFHPQSHIKIAAGITIMNLIFNFFYSFFFSQVNLDSLTKDSIVLKMAQPTQTTFDQAQKRIQGVLEADAYSRFLKSDLYLELVHPERYDELPSP